MSTGSHKVEAKGRKVKPNVHINDDGLINPSSPRLINSFVKIDDYEVAERVWHS